jgi:hypothetical protein
MRPVATSHRSSRGIVRVVVFIALCGLTSHGCTKKGEVATTLAGDPGVTAWYQTFYAKMAKPQMSDAQLKQIRNVAPLYLFLEKPELAAEEFNIAARAAKSRAAATQTYWAALRQFNEFRRGYPSSIGELLAANKKRDPSYNVSQDMENLTISIFRYCSLMQECTAINSLEFKRVDERAVNWAAEYLAWLQKVQRLELAATPDLAAQSQVPGAIAESMLRLGMGDPNYFAPLDEQRRAEGQRVAKTLENSKSYGELSDAAADISAHCMKVRAALGKDYSIEFAEIKLQ